MTRKVNRPYLPKGRAAKEPPANAAVRIAALAATGHSVVGIARGLNTSQDVLRRWMEEYPELEEAMTRGREAERLALHNVLYTQATQHGNIVAAMFLLKARHGYKEGDQGETANKVSITFALPGALSADDYKVIEHDPPSNPNLPVPSARTARS
jgi:hypothetical protein